MRGEMVRKRSPFRDLAGGLVEGHIVIIVYYHEKGKCLWHDIIIRGRILDGMLSRTLFP